MCRMKKLDLSSHLDEEPKNACFAICSPPRSEQLLLQCRIFASSPQYIKFS